MRLVALVIRVQKEGINATETEKKPEKKIADAPPKKKKKTELSLREEIEQEMQDGPGEAPTVSDKFFLIVILWNTHLDII